MATDSFTSTSAAVSAHTGVFSVPTLVQGNTILTRQAFWQVKVNPGGVSISKASTFGGVQNAIPVQFSLDAARDLAQALIKATT